MSYILLIPFAALVVQILIIIFAAVNCVCRFSGGRAISISRVSVDIALYAPVIVRRYLS
jgi:hypothetical protein